MAERHPLHIATKRILKEVSTEFDSIEFLFDTACDSPNTQERSHQLPLFVDRDKNNVTKYCQVDSLALRASGGRKEVAVIVEIEESGISQIKILGKVLASAVCQFYIHDTEGGIPIPIAKGASFIQILRERGDGQKKRQKWKDIERRIDGMLPIGGSRIHHYRLLHGTLNDFRLGGRCETDLKRVVEDHLQVISREG